MRKTLMLLLVGSVALAACGGAGSDAPESVTLLAHDSFVGSVSEDTFASFTEDTGIDVEVTSGGDAGAMVTEAALSADNPIADVMFGVDDTFLSRAIDEDVFAAYQSPLLDRVEAELVPATDRVTPIDFGDVCFNYDKAALAAAGLQPPASLDELRSPEYAGLTTVTHPAISSPGLAFLLATISEYGEDGWQEFWTDLASRGVNVVSDWTTAYTAEFTRYGGDSPIVLSYASSPPFEVLGAEEPVEEAPTGVIEAGCYRQVEYAGVLLGTEHPDAAGELIDFMLSTEFQETIPLTWFVFPANTEAQIPDDFIDHTTIPSDPARIDHEQIAENRERWIDQWVAIMDE